MKLAGGSDVSARLWPKHCRETVGGCGWGWQESRLAASVQMQKCADSLKVEIYITEVYQPRCGRARVYSGAGWI